jgi:hypothetical protein
MKIINPNLRLKFDPRIYAVMVLFISAGLVLACLIYFMLHHYVHCQIGIACISNWNE